MWITSVKTGDCVIFSDGIEIRVYRCSPTRLKLAVTMPKEIRVMVKHAAVEETPPLPVPNGNVAIAEKKKRVIRGNT